MFSVSLDTPLSACVRVSVHAHATVALQSIMQMKHMRKSRNGGASCSQEVQDTISQPENVQSVIIKYIIL